MPLKEKTVKIHLELPSDALFEQIMDGNGKVLSTLVEAELTLEEIHRGLSEYESALQEYAWGAAEE